MHYSRCTGHTLFSCLVLAFFLTACTRDEDTDYCKNHYRFHDSHENAPGQLLIDLSDAGELLATLSLPAALLGPEADTTGVASGLATHGLDDPTRVYDLHAAQPCEMSDSRAVRNNGSAEFRYEYRCGKDNKLGQIDIKLFDVLPQLDEMEVNITTPATAKHFAISRQCSQPIFRLK
jgi:Protein of unknown function (DUF2796)